MSKKSITVEDYRSRIGTKGCEFRVRAMVNTIDFEIGEFVSEDEIKTIALDPDYKVTIVGKR